jgi:hypothetical protein
MGAAADAAPPVDDRSIEAAMGGTEVFTVQFL